MADTKSYISQVQVPVGTGLSTYWIKDTDAWSRLDAIEDAVTGAVHFLGKASAEDNIEENSTTNPVHIGTKTVTAVAGDIVYTEGSGTGASAEKEFIFNGTSWQEFGSTSALKAMAFASQGTASYTPAGSITGTHTAASTTLNATKIDVSLETPVTNKPSVVTAVTSEAITYVTAVSSVTNPTVTVTPTTKAVKVSVPASTWLTGVSYSKVTSATVTVNNSATFSGTTDSNVVTDATITKGAVTATITAATSGVTGSQKIVTDITNLKATGGAVTVGALSVFGLSASNSKYMTGPESLSKAPITVMSSIVSHNCVTASVSGGTGETDGILILGAATISYDSASVLSATTSITNGTSATATTYTPGASGTANITTVPTITATVTSANYVATIASDTVVTDVSLTKESVGVTVSGSAVTNGTVTVNSTKTAADLTKNTATTLGIQEATGGFTVATGITSANATGTSVVLSTATASAVTGVTYSYPTVSAYAGGSHTHTINGSLGFSGTAATITVNPKS